MNSQIQLRSYEGWKADGAAMVSLWNEAMGEAFPMDLRLWRQNMDDDPQFDQDGMMVALEGDAPAGFVVARVMRVPLGTQPLDTARGFINSIAVSPAHQRKGIGRRLMERAHDWLRARQVGQVQAGGDPGHFFPGVPSTLAAAHGLFERCGYDANGDPCYDLHRELKGFRVPALAERVLARNVHFRISECTGRTVPALLEFLRASFPGRWLYETQMRLESERSPQDIQVLMIGNRVVGFAHTFYHGSRRLGPSVYWRKLLGGQYGGLGPMGVSADVRNTGLGFALLCASIDRLRGLGVTHMAIDWTVLKKFYGAAGFTPWKEYQSYRRSL